VRTASPRSAFTLLELLVVLALLIILAAVAIPSLAGLKGNADQKTAADQLRARIADARGLAMQESVPYRLAINPDGTRIRVAADTAEFASTPCAEEGGASSLAIETMLKNATVAIVADEEVSDASDTWSTIAVFLPNGTCRPIVMPDGTTREVQTVVEVREVNFPSMHIQIRGLTGTSIVLAPDAAIGGMK
jgi:prepilin-type N-terminal cleavage/methylation domain-containing protein